MYPAYSKHDSLLPLVMRGLGLVCICSEYYFPSHSTDQEHIYAVLNMHELAVTSGFAAAYQLGADYPFKGDEDCERLFRLYLALSHGVRLVSVSMSLEITWA